MASTQEVLNDLIAQRDRLNRAIDALRGLNEVATKAVVAPRIIQTNEPAPKKRQYRRTRRESGTFPKAIMALFETNPGDYSAKDVTTLLPSVGVNGKRSSRYVGTLYALRRLAAKGRLEKTGDTYHLPRPAAVTVPEPVFAGVFAPGSFDDSFGFSRGL